LSATKYVSQACGTERPTVDTASIGTWQDGSPVIHGGDGPRFPGMKVPGGAGSQVAGDGGR